MATEGTGLVVILAMHVVGNRPANGDKTRSRRHRQKPAARHEHIEDVGQQRARFTDQNATLSVEGNQMVESARLQQRRTAVQANVAIAATIAIG